MALGAATANADGPVEITAERLQARAGIDLGTGWRYAPGDDPARAETAFDDASWELLPSPKLGPNAIPASGWPGIGWFRRHVTVDDSVASVPVAIALAHSGASEVYVDGRLVRRFGVVGATPDAETPHNPQGTPTAFVFGSPGEHTIAIRYSCADAVPGASAWSDWVVRRGGFFGFDARLEEASGAAMRFADARAGRAAVQELIIGVLAALGVVHMLLFAFRREERENLFSSLYTLSFAALVGSEQIVFTQPLGIVSEAFVNLFGLVALAGVFLSFVAFLVCAFHRPFTWTYWALCAAWGAAVLVQALFLPSNSDLPVTVCITLSIGSSIGAMIDGLRRRVDGAGIIAAGVVGFAAALTCQLVRNAMGGSGLLQILSLLLYFVLPVSVSVLVARRFARTSRDLEAKLVEVEELSRRAIEQERREAEHERKTRELDEARALQLSMLPRSLPELPHLEIAVFMQTASEVGGDYYDFFTSEDGTLTIAVGDATGHGLRAGTLVATTKGLFRILAAEPDIRGTFRRVTKTLKDMRLGQLYMAMTIARLRGSSMTISAAGMPPALVYRASTGEVEEIVLKGMPLGAFVDFRYEEREVELAPGDAVLLLSDGLPETFDDRNEMLGYGRATELFAEFAALPPSEAIARLTLSAREWAKGRPPDDDMTLVLLKVRATAVA